MLAPFQEIEQHRTRQYAPSRGQHTNGGGFPGTVLTKQREHLTRLNIEVDTIYSPVVAKLFAQIFGLDHIIISLAIAIVMG
jgi:hypothetical protein